MEKRIKQAILNFEPRIIPETLRVNVETDRQKMSIKALKFKIEGQLWAQPLPVSLYVSTELDVETGNATVQETTG